MQGIRILDGSLRKNEIVAHRRIVVTTLENCLAFDVIVSSIDLNAETGLIAVAAGKIVYLLSNNEEYRMVGKLGRGIGSMHKENITNCCFNNAGTYLASCSSDRRIVIWNLSTLKSQKVLEGHKGVINQLWFSNTDETLYSSSEDGKILMWDWMSGEVTASFIRHPSAITSFSINRAVPHKISCGRSDGQVTTWDTSQRVIIDSILADPEWTERGNENIGLKKFKHHSGSVTCVEISPNSHFLASGSSDKTCKLWNITSYAKDHYVVKMEEEHEKSICIKLDQCIDILDESYDVQLKNGDFFGLKAGEVPMQTGFHADILFTYRHDSAVLNVKFNTESTIVITGSVDNTCRLWSTKRGTLLFQINTPSPVSSMHVDRDNKIYATCENRLLILGIKANSKESELPDYWRESEIEEAFNSFDNDVSKRLASADSEEDRSAFGDRDQSAENLKRRSAKRASFMASGIIYKNGILNDHQNPFLESQNFEFNTPEKSLAKIVSKKEQKITREELRKLISRGLVLPSFLDNILEELPEIDKEQLFKNMKKYNTDAKQILKLINSGFDAASVLKQLSSDKKVYVDALYSHVTNNKFKDFMLRHGFEEERAEEEDDEYAGLNFLINSSLRKTDKKIEPKGENGLIHKYNTANLAVGSDKVKHKRRFTYNIYGEKVYDYDEDGNFEDFSEMEKYDELGQKRGKVVHFLPSEQMKLIKDYQQKREVKNVFLNRLFLKQTVPLQYPNFSPNVEVRDTTPKLPEKFPNGTRFNEPLKGRAYPRINHKKREEEIFLQNLYNKQHQQNSRKIFKDKSTMNGSSKMIFNPERYFNARGLNIIFEDTEKVKEKKPPAALYRGRVFAAPVVYRQEGHIRDSLIVGKSAIVTPNQYDLNLLP